jgi:hypothetical protein
VTPYPPPRACSSGRGLGAAVSCNAGFARFVLDRCRIKRTPEPSRVLSHRRSRKAAKRSETASGVSRVRAARTHATDLRSPFSCPACARRHCRRGGRDNPSRPPRGCDEHEQGVMGDLYLPGLRKGLPPGDLSSGSRSSDQGRRNSAPRGTRQSAILKSPNRRCPQPLSKSKLSVGMR